MVWSSQSTRSTTMKSQFRALTDLGKCWQGIIAGDFSTLLTTYTGFVIPVVHGDLNGELLKGLIARWCTSLLLIEIVFAVFDGADMLMERTQQTPNSKEIFLSTLNRRKRDARYRKIQIRYLDLLGLHVSFMARLKTQTWGWSAPISLHTLLQIFTWRSNPFQLFP